MGLSGTCELGYLGRWRINESWCRNWYYLGYPFGDPVLDEHSRPITANIQLFKSRLSDEDYSMEDPSLKIRFSQDRLISQSSVLDFLKCTCLYEIHFSRTRFPGQNRVLSFENWKSLNQAIVISFWRSDADCGRISLVMHLWVLIWVKRLSFVNFV